MQQEAESPWQCMSISENNDNSGIVSDIGAPCQPVNQNQKGHCWIIKSTFNCIVFPFLQAISQRASHAPIELPPTNLNPQGRQGKTPRKTHFKNGRNLGRDYPSFQFNYCVNVQNYLQY